MQLLRNRNRPPVANADERYYQICRAGFSFALIQHILFIGIFYALSVPLLPQYNILSAILFVVALVVNEKRHFHAAMAIAFVEIAVHQILATIILGWESGFHLYLLFCVMLPLLTSRGHILWKIGIAGTSLAVIFYLVIVYRTAIPVMNLSPGIIGVFAVVNQISTVLILIVIAYVFNATVLSYEESLASEFQYANSLLLNILPESIAKRLGTESGSIADRFSETSVLFADIANFTSFAESTSPDRLVQLLDHLFVRFDNCTDLFQCEKIKTIGDAYMVASGIPEHVENHAEQLIRLGFQMLNELELFNHEEGVALSLRVGIHSGPAVAGVIGRKKFSYDLWGDTVNTASRMESSGVEGAIQVTQAVKDRVGELFQFESRGTIEIKGKGPIETFLVT